LNPRRPTPSGPEPVEEMSFYNQGIEWFYPRQEVSEGKPISGKSNVGQVCISLSDSLLEEFVNWLKSEEGTSDRTVRDYVNYLRKGSRFEALR